MVEHRRSIGHVSDLPKGFLLHGVNGNQLRVEVRKPGASADYRLVLRVGSSTASVSFERVDALIRAVHDNFSQALAYRQCIFPGTTSLSVFGGAIDGARYVALVCGGRTVRLNASGVEIFVDEVSRLKQSVHDFISTKCQTHATALTGG